MSNQVSDVQILSAVNSSAVDNAYNQLHNTQTILTEQNASSIENMAANERLKIAGDKSVQENALYIQSSVERNGTFNNDTTYRTASELSTAIERNSANAVSTVQSANNVLQSSIERTSSDINTAQHKIASDTRHMIGQNNISAALLGRDEQLDIVKSGSFVQLQASNYFNKTELKVQEVKSELQFQAVKDTASIQLEAIRDKALLESSIELCLCDLKTKVVDTAFQTQKTAKDLENARVRDALNSAQTQKLIYRLKASSGTSGSTCTC